MFSMKTGYQSKAGRILMASLSLILVCMFTMGAVFDGARKKVTLVQVDAFAGTENVTTISTRKATVGEFLAENEVTVGEYDEVNMKNDAPIYDEAKIVIREGKVFELVADGKIEVAATTESTVGKALEEVGIVLGPNDVVIPDKTTAVAENMTVTVQRIDVAEETVTTPIPFTTVEQPDSTLYVGTNKMLTQGAEGTKETVYKVTRQDGVEVSREIVSETVTKEPVNAVKGIGTKPIPAPVKTEAPAVKAASTSNQTKTKDFSYSRKIQVTATAYDTSPGENGGYAKTAYGLKPQFGVVAVDPKVIPLGTKLYIESSDGGKSWTYGYCIAGDTGGAIKGNRVDLCYNTQRECINFGRRSATVYILD